MKRVLKILLKGIDLIRDIVQVFLNPKDVMIKNLNLIEKEGRIFVNYQNISWGETKTPIFKVRKLISHGIGVQTVQGIDAKGYCYYAKNNGGDEWIFTDENIVYPVRWTSTGG